jgi:hypothetical protein
LRVADGAAAAVAAPHAPPPQVATSGAACNLIGSWAAGT